MGQPLGCEGPRQCEEVEGQAKMVRRGISGVPAPLGRQGQTGEASGPSGAFGVTWHQQLFPASRREPLPRPISTRRAVQGHQDAPGLVEWCLHFGMQGLVVAQSGSSV